MKHFRITDFWQNKQKRPTPKTNPKPTLPKRTRLIKDEWDMSPEDALRVTYSTHK